MATLRLMLEALRLFIEAYKFITNEISEQQFNSAVNDRKKSYNAFKEADRIERMKLLRDKIK